MDTVVLPGWTDLSAANLSLIAATAGAVALYALYRRCLPRPIPGIPYDETAAKSLLGDVPSMLEEMAGESSLGWMLKRASRYPRGLSQIFVQPLSAPYLMLSDYREAQDILLRRANDWDRSDYSIDILSGVGPNHHINLKTGPAWKAHRRLLQDLMMPAFLHGVAAPNIYNSVLNLIGLWELKVRASQGRPFEAGDDMTYASLDAVSDFTFGNVFKDRALIPQQRHLGSLDEDTLQRLRDAAGQDGAVDFPKAPVHDFYQSIIHSCKKIGESIMWPRARLFWWFNRLKPSENVITRNRYAFIEDQVRLGVERLEDRNRNVDKSGGGGGGGDEDFLSAIDLMLDRETKFAAKEGRAPIYHSQSIYDEIGGIIFAGHDTTATTLMWGLKLLADAPEVQAKLREALRSSHEAAAREARLPTSQEIEHTSIPYLDAVMEEILRVSGPLPVLERQAIRDTNLLGYFVPKGTILFILGRGAGFTEPGFDIDESVRSPTSQAAAKERGARRWHPEGMDEFRPERWLVDKQGQVEFDLAAGPSLPFGDGIRGCFGRRLGYLQVRIVLTLVAWTFELLEPGEGLMSNGGIDDLTRKPTQCYVRLKKNSV